MSKSIRLAAVLAALGLSSAALAEETGVYFGGGVGTYGVDIDEIDFDGSDQFVRALVGLRLSDNLAIEGDYVKLFETKDDILGGNAELEADAWGISVRPILPLSDSVELYGRAGWTWYDARFSATGLGVPLTVNVEDEDSAFTWGGGVDLRFWDNLSLRADFSRIELEDTDLNLVSAQLVFRF